MIIIGDSLVPFESITKISSKKDLNSTKANSLVLFYFDEDMLKYCFANKIEFAIVVDSIKDAIYANSLNSKYIVCKKSLAKKLQKVADNYMFDSKILAVIKSNDEFEEIALDEIDGVIYKELI